MENLDPFAFVKLCEASHGLSPFYAQTQQSSVQDLAAPVFSTCAQCLDERVHQAWVFMIYECLTLIVVAIAAGLGDLLWRSI